MKKMNMKINSVLMAFTLMMISTSASAATDPGFLSAVKEAWCFVLSSNGPLVPILAGTAIVAIAIAMMFGEEKGGIVGTSLKVVFGIGLVVGLGGILSLFGVDMGCSTSNLNFIL